jgi:hypothetical protein
MDKQPQSDVIKFMDLVWHSVHAADLSWQRVNAALRRALKLSVEAGFVFAPDDFSYVIEHYRSQFWIGESDEWFYAEAILNENKSAIDSFEKRHSRQPVIADNVSLYLGHHYVDRKRCRLAVGFEFSYGGERPRVTSFGDGHLVACTSKDDRIVRRLTLTRDDIVADRAQRKAAAKEGAQK